MRSVLVPCVVYGVHEYIMRDFNIQIKSTHLVTTGDAIRYTTNLHDN